MSGDIFDMYLDYTTTIFHFTCAGVFPGRWPVTGLDKHLLSISLDHVNIFADLLERHLKNNQTC